MRRGVAWVTMAIVLLGNAAALVHVWRNRVDGPAARIELSERELRPPTYQPTENSAVLLQLHWLVVPAHDAETPGEFRYRWSQTADASLMEKLGFDTHPRQDGASGERAPVGPLQRLAYGAFELDGAGWQLCKEWYEKAIAAEPDAEKKRALDNELATSTRLVLVDTDRDAAALRSRQRDPQRVLILPVAASLFFARRSQDPAKHEWEPRGRLEPLVALFNVPRELRGPIDAAQPQTPAGSTQSGRYRVTLACGARDECWVEATHP